MPQDPNLYGHRPAKKQKRELALSDTLDFAAQLRSVMKPKASTATATKTKAITTPLALSSRPRAPKDDLDGVRVRRRKRDAAAAAADDSNNLLPPPNRLRVKSPPPGSAADLDAAARDRIRRNMEAKARRYAALQRGDDDGGGKGPESSLVDFDRKWAERRQRGADSDPDSDDDDSDESAAHDDDQDTDLVELTDEFGRTRRVSRAERSRALRRQARAARSAADLADMRARPQAAPAGVVYGDVIQTEAVETQDVIASSDEPPPDTHYRADLDVRTRGAAFYQLAADDEAVRRAQMQALADERARTEAARATRHDEADARRQALETRRAALAERRAAAAERQAQARASRFLDGLGAELFQDKTETAAAGETAPDRTDEDKKERSSAEKNNS